MFVLFISRIARAFVRGAIDEVRDTLCRAPEEEAINAASHEVGKFLPSCTPIEDHLNRDARKEICNALRKCDVRRVTGAIDDGTTDTSAPWCITAIKLAATFACSEAGPKFIKDATWNLLGC